VLVVGATAVTSMFDAFSSRHSHFVSKRPIWLAETQPTARQDPPASARSALCCLSNASRRSWLPSLANKMARIAWKLKLRREVRARRVGRRSLEISQTRGAT
jgi:hypothetical protein